MKPLLVRRRDIEAAPPPDGTFRSVRFDRGMLPAFTFATFGTYCVDTDERVFAITYDDGPHPEHTPRILDLLAERQAVATFFVLAEPATAHPDIVRRIVAEGHELALHGWDHRALTSMSDDEALASIARSRAVVEDIAGERITLYRPPYGSHTLRHARAVRRRGLELTLWSGDATDWVDDAAESVAERAIARVFPGTILLLHDARADPETLQPGQRLPAFDKATVLARILDHAQREGFTTARAGTLLRTYPSVKSMSRQALYSP